jgi:hypothetical protein
MVTQVGARRCRALTKMLTQRRRGRKVSLRCNVAEKCRRERLVMKENISIAPLEGHHHAGKIGSLDSANGA